MAKYLSNASIGVLSMEWLELHSHLRALTAGTSPIFPFFKKVKTAEKNTDLPRHGPESLIASSPHLNVPFTIGCGT